MNTKCNCGKELVYDELRKCYHCATCRPRKNGAGRPEAKLTEARVREIVKEEFEKFLAPDIMPGPVDITPKTWQEEAKAMGINPYGRKKEIVLAEMAEQTEASQTGQNDQPETAETE